MSVLFLQCKDEFEESQINTYAALSGEIPKRRTFEGFGDNGGICEVKSNSIILPTLKLVF